MYISVSKALKHMFTNNEQKMYKQFFSR